MNKNPYKKAVENEVADLVYKGYQHYHEMKEWEKNRIFSLVMMEHIDGNETLPGLLMEYLDEPTHERLQEIGSYMNTYPKSFYIGLINNLLANCAVYFDSCQLQWE